MKKIFSLFALTLCFFTLPSQALMIRHSSTVYVNMGICSAAFLFNGQGYEYEDVQIEVTVQDSSGKKIATDTLIVKELGPGTAFRHAVAFIENEKMCDDGLKIVIEKASAKVEGKTMDLIKSKRLTIDEFKPFKIEIKK